MGESDSDDVEKILKDYINSDSSKEVKENDILEVTEYELGKYLAPSPRVKTKRKPQEITYQYDSCGKRIYKVKTNRVRKRKKKTTDEEVTDFMVDKVSAETELGSEMELGAEIEVGTLEDNNPINEFDNELEACTEALQTFLKSTGKERKKKTWTQKMMDTEDQWSDIRADLLRASIKKFCPTEKCGRCTEISATILCGTCGYLCFDCDEQVHYDHPFHDRLGFVGEQLLALSTNEVVIDGKLCATTRLIELKNVFCCNCFVMQDRCEKIPLNDMVVVVGLKGRFCFNKWDFICSSCSYQQSALDLNNILSSGYWPASPKNFNTIVQEDLFIFWDSFRKRMPGSSAKAFVDTMNDLSIRNGRDGSLYPQLLAHSFKEWCFLQYELDCKKGFDWMQCPCCEVFQHSCHVDGNCKLYRFKSGGIRRRDSYYNEKFIVNYDRVKDYLKLVYPTKKKQDLKDSDYVCGGKWTAAKNIGRRKGKLDETGLEVGTCRHRFGQKGLNMKQGELYGYPLYIIKHHMLPRKVEFAWSDVMCKLWGFAKRIEPSIANKLKPALSVMHAKGHSLECQMKWDGQWLENTGRTTGEETEQYFSYIGRCSNTTKYQLPEGREETITELTMHWNWRKTISLPFQLTNQYNKNERNLAENKDNFERTCKQNNFEYTKSAVMDLKANLEASLPKSEKGTVEHKIEALYFEKTYWKSVLKKVGDRSKRRSFIRRKISKVKDAMVTALREKSGFISHMEDCFNGNFPWKEVDGGMM